MVSAKRVARRVRPRGITALSIFFAAGAAIAFTAAVSLLLPNSFLAPLWRLNPHGHESLVKLGSWAVLLMLTVSALCAAAAIGLWRCARWAYWLAVGLIFTNLLGSLGNLLLRAELRAIVGIPIAAALLAYLLFNVRRQMTSRR